MRQGSCTRRRRPGQEPFFFRSGLVFYGPGAGCPPERRSSLAGRSGVCSRYPASSRRLSAVSRSQGGELSVSRRGNRKPSDTPGAAPAVPDLMQSNSPDHPEAAKTVNISRVVLRVRRLYRAFASSFASRIHDRRKAMRRAVFYHCPSLKPVALVRWWQPGPVGDRFAVCPGCGGGARRAVQADRALVCGWNGSGKRGSVFPPEPQRLQQSAFRWAFGTL